MLKSISEYEFYISRQIASIRPLENSTPVVVSVTSFNNFGKFCPELRQFFQFGIDLITPVTFECNVHLSSFCVGAVALSCDIFYQNFIIE